MCYFVFPRGRVGHGGKGRGGDGRWFEVRAQSDVNLKLREDIHSTGNDSTGKSS